MTALTDKDNENLARVSAMLASKAQAYETAIPNKTMSKRFKAFHESLEKARAVLRERTAAKGSEAADA